MTISHLSARRFGLVVFAVLTLFITGCQWGYLASVNSDGDQGNASTIAPAISGDGRFVAFASAADNLVLGDSNGFQDIFVRDTFTGTTTRVSVDSNGVEANQNSRTPAISSDGRYVAFSSTASNLVVGSNVHLEIIFVHDRQTGAITQASVDRFGFNPNAQSYFPALSADGRYVGFSSLASDLVKGDTNGASDVFVYDMLMGTTTRVSVDREGNQVHSGGDFPSFSEDGRYVAFQSRGINLVANDTNNSGDSFVRDLQTGTNTRVSVDSSGNEGDGSSFSPRISADGRHVTFASVATNLVAEDTNEATDVFVYDRQTGTTARVSVDNAGNEGNSWSSSPAISANGRYVAFYSTADNLVLGDTYGNSDVFVHDRQKGTTSRASVGIIGNEANGDSTILDLSADGRYVAFETEATNLAPNVNDLNGATDIVMRAVPQMVVKSIVPQMLPIAATTSITLTGRNFLPGTTVHINGEWGTQSNMAILDENTITLDISVNPSAVSGTRDIVVQLPGTGPGPHAGSIFPCLDCLTIF